MITEKTTEAFRDGFFLPVKWILIYSIFGLPLYFYGKKHPKAAKVIKRVGIGVIVLVLLALILN